MTYYQQPGQNDYYYQQQPPYNPQYAQQQPTPNYYAPATAPIQPVIYSDPPKTHYKDNSPLTKEENQRLRDDNPCRDKLWAIVFVIQVIVVVVLSIYYYNKNSDFLNDDNSDDTIVSQHFWVLAFVSLVSGIASAMLWIFWIKTCANALIWFSLILCLCMWIIMGLFFFVAGQPIGGIFCFIFAALQALWMYCVRDRIAFAAAVLKLAVIACNEFSSVYLVSMLAMIAQAIWMIIWTMGVCFVIYDGQNNTDCDVSQQDSNGNCPNNISSGVVFLFTLSFYWTSQVIANIVFVTASGVVATWYFLFPNQTPSSTVGGALKRSCWNSLGSICFGSFIIALIQTLRAMIQASKNSKNDFLKCCADCILGCIENIVNYFNTYAFARVAIYGSTYCEAAKETWELFKHKGCTMIINDDLINGVLTLACLFAAAFAAVITMLFAYEIYDIKDWYYWALLAALIGFVLTLCAVIVVRAGVVSIFVCFVDDPAVLAETKPRENEELVTAWTKRYGKLPAQLTNPPRYQ